MRARTVGAAVLATGATVLLGHQVIRRLPNGGRNGGPVGGQDRWHSITINCEPERLGSLPPPLDELDIPVEVRIRPAPAGRGTELAVRAAEPVPTGPGTVLARLRGDDPVRPIRRALREARSLAEVGEVLLPDAPPTTRVTLMSRPLAYATRHGREEGRL